MFFAHNLMNSIRLCLVLTGIALTCASRTPAASVSDAVDLDAINPRAGDSIQRMAAATGGATPTPTNRTWIAHLDVFHDWLYFEITPQVEFPEERDHDSTFSLRVGLDMFMGKKWND